MMKSPKIQESLYWRKRKTPADGISAAVDSSKKKKEFHDFSATINEPNKKEGMSENQLAEKKALLLRLMGKQHAKRISTQQDRRLFCLENPNRPMHLAVSIANYTNLLLPKWQPLVPGHCCILPIQAIEEAEDEWSQHNAKKLIDTSLKGLRSSIPAHFPYFHVEFGLNKGFVHVEKRVNGSFGLNVIRGMLHLAEQHMHRRRRYEAVHVQKQVVASFLKEWKPFDWTKQLHEQ